jgi:hypothetical protein
MTMHDGGSLDARSDIIVLLYTIYTAQYNFICNFFFCWSFLSLGCLGGEFLWKMTALWMCLCQSIYVPQSAGVKQKKQKQKKDGGKSFALLDMEKSTRSSADIGFCLYSSQTYDMSLLYRTFYFILFYYGTIELYIVGRRLYRSKWISPHFIAEWIRRPPRLFILIVPISVSDCVIREVGRF